MKLLALSALALLGACAGALEVQPVTADRLAFEEEQILLPDFWLADPNATTVPEHWEMVVAPPITAICNDRWLSYSQHRSGTCAGHGGVREWVNRPPD